MSFRTGGLYVEVVFTTGPSMYTVLKIAVGHRSFSVQKFDGVDIPVNSRPSCQSKMADR